MFDLTPFRKGRNDIFDFFNEMERNFIQSFSDGGISFKTDIVDKGDRLILEAELPGYDKEDINIEVNNNRLIISVQQDLRIEDNRDDYIRRERRYGSFIRSFDVSNIRTEDIKAKYEKGVLILDLPKKHESGSNTTKIDIH